MLFEYTKRSNLLKTIHRFDQNNETRKLIIYNRENFSLLYDAFLSLFKQVEAAGGIVFDHDKGMLWILRHNRWDLPKGKTAPGENIEAAAIREVEEETGLRNVKITASLGTTHHAYVEKNDFILKTSHWFKMETPDSDVKLVPQLNEGITLVEWADKTNINEKINNTYASLRELARDFVATYTKWEL